MIEGQNTEVALNYTITHSLLFVLIIGFNS